MDETAIPEQRAVIADHDDEGVHVYQAFKPGIVEEAVRRGTFGKGFNLDRLTWIKPSFGWMLHRSAYATAHRQERIARIKLPHDAFLAILRQAVPTAHDPRLFPAKGAWRAALERTEVRYQWDPDRDWCLGKLPRRAIQLGLRGAVVRRYVTAILRVEDATPLARACAAAAAARRSIPPSYPAEREYPVPDDVRRVLGYD
jgi:hypothetical protein